jgi:hypothetical protein
MMKTRDGNARRILIDDDCPNRRAPPESPPPGGIRKHHHQIVGLLRLRHASNRDWRDHPSDKW